MSGKSRNSSIEPDIDSAIDYLPFSEGRSCIRLWASVFNRGVRDYCKAIEKGGDRKVIAWFDSHSEEVGSFNWICDLLCQNPVRLRLVIKKNSKRLLESGQGKKKTHEL